MDVLHEDQDKEATDTMKKIQKIQNVTLFGLNVSQQTFCQIRLPTYDRGANSGNRKYFVVMGT